MDDKPEGDGAPRHQSAPLRGKKVLMRAIDSIRTFFKRIKWPRSGRRILLYCAGGAAALLAGSALALYVVLKMVEPVFPHTDLYTLNRPQALIFLDQHGARVGVRGAVVGERLKLSDMPSYLPAAFLAMEDRNFYHHHGVDPKGLLRALWVDVTAGHLVQGGSTITQQVVKIVLLTPDRTMSRKLTEISGALALERRLSKEQILELYLNRLYLGSGAYGVDGAAHVYFGKSARHVTLAEAAMLAALTTSPSTFSPRRDLAAAQARADLVLTQMVATGAMKASDVAYARAHPATIIDPGPALGAGYFLDAAADEAKTLAPGAMGDLTIETTMDPKMQQTAHSMVANVLARQGAKAHASQAALVAMAPDGAVRALIGGRDYADSTFDRATEAHRQPGSAFKPFVYLAALENGLTPDTIRTDQPISIKQWSPDNYSDTFLGPVTLREAFAQSLNSVAVQLGQEVGMQSVIAVARRLGITSPLEPNASLALGTSEVTPLELTASYASFANMGMRATPYLIQDIRGSDGTVLYQRNAPAPSRIVSQDNVLSMNEMFYEVVQSGTGRAAAVPGHEVAGKTGTSADYHDAWFVGFSTDLITGVWVGNDDSSPMKNVTGGGIPAQIWSGFMRVALQNGSDLPLPRAMPMPQPETDQASDNDDEGPVARGLDGVGHFFQRLFNGNPPPETNDQPRPRREATRDDEDTRNRYSADDRGDDDTADDAPYNRYPPPPPPGYGPNPYAYYGR